MRRAHVAGEHVSNVAVSKSAVGSPARRARSEGGPQPSRLLPEPPCNRSDLLGTGGQVGLPLVTCASGEVAAVDPGGDDRGVLLRRFLPGEMAGVEDVEAAVG